MRDVIAPLFCLLFAAAPTPAATLDEVPKLDAELEETEAQLRYTEAAIEVLREQAGSPEVEAARRAVAEAEQAHDAARTAAGLDAVEQRLADARAARGAAAKKLVAASPRGQELIDKVATMEARVDTLEGKMGSLTPDEVEELATLRVEHRHWSRYLGGLQRAMWDRGEVKPHYQKADAAYKAASRANRKAKEQTKATGDRLKAARKSLDQALADVELTGEQAASLTARRDELTARRAELKEQIDTTLRAASAGGERVSITVDMPDRKGKPQKPRKLTFWYPGSGPLRGVIVASGQVSNFASHPRILAVAARHGLGTMVMPNMTANGEESWQRLDAILDTLADKTGHPELRGAPALTAGLSASVLATRNFGYANPDRTIGTVQIAGGNMHHAVQDRDQSLAGVPFIAMNGELEWCGPEGGIRPEYGRQTQWVMIREQLLRRRRADADHLMSLVVVPGADHGAWDVKLAALFVDKAATYRLPDEPGDGSAPVKCKPLKAEDGWLTDADITTPEHEPAAWADYTGDKAEAFWHFDGEMAKAVRAYHKDRFILDDPTDDHPVPASWPKSSPYAEQAD